MKIKRVKVGSRVGMTGMVKKPMIGIVKMIIEGVKSEEVRGGEKFYFGHFYSGKDMALVRWSNGEECWWPVKEVHRVELK